MKGWSKNILPIALLFVGGLGLFSCQEKANSRPSYIFKPAPSAGAALKLQGTIFQEKDIFKGIEGDLYDLEQKIYETKMNKLRAFLLEKFMTNHPDKKNLSNDEFLDKIIAKNLKISDKSIDAFIKEKNIPQEHINAELKERVRSYLEQEEKRKVVEVWLDKQLSKDQVEVYLVKPKRPVFEVMEGNSPSLGKEDAKVTLVEFSDFQCPFCAKASTLVHDLKKKYGDKIKVVFKNFPLPFHQHANLAAQAGLCSHEQGKDLFWKMHDLMFAQQDKLDEKSLMEKAKTLKLDTTAFEQCLKTQKYAAEVKKTFSEGEVLGVKSTPTFFINGQLLSGAQSMEVFSEIIDEELAK
jgi:protein-disulfide isomerase